MTFLPEGCLAHSEENQNYLRNESSLNEAMKTKAILEARAVM